jgi:hypothetical protein
MRILPGMKQIIVESEEQFDTVLHEHAIVVEFANEFEEREYESKDSRLADAIQSLMVEIFGETNEGVLFHQNFDWWPTCTRFLEIDSLCVTWDFINRLRKLLIGDVKDWRVNIHVYDPLEGKESDHVGGLNVYSDWILVQKRVHCLLPKSL